MLDVHAPDHSLHGKRDFLIHMLTITLGLLIAIALENTVEALHHRHQRREAEETIRRELTSDRDLITSNAQQVLDERKVLDALLTALENRAAGQALPSMDRAKVQFHEAPIPDSAWRTAGSTGVLSYMNYDEVGRFADAYKELAMLQAAEESALDDYLQFMPILRNGPDKISPAVAAEALPLVRRAYAHVTGMIALGGGALESVKQALQ